MNKKIPIVVVAGPTASGKTSLSIQLAKKLNGEIVSADSMQIYKFMDIGTAKPTKEEMDGIKHYLIDEIDPSVNFSVAEYTDLAHKYIETIYKSGKLPILTGGTGLYINSVVNDITFDDDNIDYSLRDNLEQLANEKGVDYLIEMLREFDPVSAKRIHANNLKRVIRAIEFYKTTGIPISVHQENTKQIQSRYNPIMIAIDWDRDILYERINKRVDLMMQMGLLDEVKNLIKDGYNKRGTAMQGIGYKEVIDYLRGFTTLSEMLEILKRNSRRYAKRQLTWFRRDDRINWLQYNNSIVANAENIIKESLL